MAPGVQAARDILLGRERRTPMTTDTTAPELPGGANGAVAAGARALSWGPPRPNRDDRPQRVWREQVLIRANELAGLATWMGTRAGSTTDAVLRTADADLDAAVRSDLEVARDAALGTSWWPSRARARMERAVGHLDAAEAVLLRRSPDDYLRGQLPGLAAHTRAHLPPAHPQRIRVQELAARYAPPEDGQPAAAVEPIPADDREALVEADRVASWAARREHARLRSFRTAVALTAFGLFLLAIAIGVVTVQQPSWMPLCFAPQGSGAIVCPTTTAAAGGTATVPPSVTAVAGAIADTARSADAVVVMLVGLAGAAVTGAATLRRMRGTSTPYAVPMTLLLLKLPTGALTAFLGLILLHGEFVPGLSALDSSGQILAWALVFGAAQQLVTGLVDKKAQSVLDSVGSAPMTEPRE
jgi:hypothetical protein